MNYRFIQTIQIKLKINYIKTIRTYTAAIFFRKRKRNKVSLYSKEQLKIHVPVPFQLRKREKK